MVKNGIYSFLGVFRGSFEAQSRLFLGFVGTSFTKNPQDGQDLPIKQAHIKHENAKGE
jgi:hypothetical protein